MRRAWELALATHRRFGADSCGFMAGAITYHAFLSMFPLLLLGASILGFVLAGNPDLHGRAVRSISESLPGIGTLVSENLQSVTATRSAAGIAGLLGLLWTGIGVAETTSFALSRVWRVEPQKSTVRKKVRALASVLTLGVIGLAGIAISIAVTSVDVSGVAAVAFRAGGVLLALGIDFVLFLAAYRLLGPPHRGVFAPWRGALLAAVGWTVLKLLGGWFAARTVANSSEVYGTFASTIGILVILFLAARIFLYGAELNATWVERTEGGPIMAKREQANTNGEQSTPQLMRSIASDTATLVKKEVELARQEMVEALVARVKAAAALLAAGVAALLGVIFLGSAAAHALSNVVDPWAARLIVGGGFFVLAGLAAAIGLLRAKRPPLKPEMTVDTVKEDVEWAKAQLKR
ncbi:MAG: YhjD/YihY/BrkB family envelope integrity protein [Actinomycetota bacterium]